MERLQAEAGTQENSRLLDVAQYIASTFRNTIRSVLTTQSFLPKAMRLLEVSDKDVTAASKCVPPCTRVLLIQRQTEMGSQSGKPPVTMDYGNYSISRQGLAHFVNDMLARLGSSTDLMKDLVTELGADWTGDGDSWVQSSIFNTSAIGNVLVFAHTCVQKRLYCDANIPSRLYECRRPEVWIVVIHKTYSNVITLPTVIRLTHKSKTNSRN